MKKLLMAAVAAGFLFSVGAGVANAQNSGNTASVDASAYSIVANAFAITSGAPCVTEGTVAACVLGGFEPEPAACTSCTIMSTTIRGDSAHHNALIITVSAVTGIFTANLNALDYHNIRAVLDAARVKLTVKVDGHDAIPGPVTFDSMLHFDLNAGTPTFINLDLSNEMSAHAFTFIYVLPNDPNVWSDHTVEVDGWVTAYADVLASSGLALTDVKAILGKRTLTVEKWQLENTHNH